MDTGDPSLTPYGGRHMVLRKDRVEIGISRLREARILPMKTFSRRKVVWVPWRTAAARWLCRFDL